MVAVGETVAVVGGGSVSGGGGDGCRGGDGGGEAVADLVQALLNPTLFAQTSGNSPFPICSGGWP